jgi:hypothetical protein
MLIHVKPTVDIHCTIDWDDESLNGGDPLVQFRMALSQKDYLAIQKGRMLTIIRRQDAKKLAVPLPTLRRRPVASGTALLAKILSTDLVELARLVARGGEAFGRPRPSL